jgi:FixJ family two-component response regulator
MSEACPTVFVVDDDESVVVALGRILQSEGFVVCGSTSAAEFLDKHDSATPGCLVTDMWMPGMNGLELNRALSEHGVHRPTVFITAEGDIPTTVQAMKAGAVTFLSKPIERGDLLGAVREAVARDAAERADYEERQEILRRLENLTRRERQVLNLVASGLLNKQVAHALGLTEKTIKAYRARVLQKMKARTGVALIGLLSRARLLSKA